MLDRLMVNGSPDANLFQSLIGGIIDAAHAGGRFPRLRAYGEMVNLLWEKGELAAALHLEELWNHLCKQRPFYLHCAYEMDPSTGPPAAARCTACVIRIPTSYRWSTTTTTTRR